MFSGLPPSRELRQIGVFPHPEGAETNFVNPFSHRYFERFGFKFRMIDSQEANTAITLKSRQSRNDSAFEWNCPK
jgi:hypothetical protein